MDDLQFNVLFNSISATSVRWETVNQRMWEMGTSLQLRYCFFILLFSGIISRLPYLQDLGIGAVWLSPFYKSPMKDFGYDISDYRQVDPLFGTMDDFNEMIKVTHDLGRLFLCVIPHRPGAEASSVRFCPLTFHADFLGN